MKKFFLHNGTEQQGPFDITDLKAKKINKDTPIWFESLSEWTTAGQINELKELFQTNTPQPFDKKTTNVPPIQNQTSTQKSAKPKESKKKSKIGRTILIVALVLVVIFVVITLITNLVSGDYNSGDTYQEKVMTVEQIERSQPTNFLSADGTYRENFWGDKLKVSCVFTNKATVATYKDAIVRVTFYTKTKTVLVEEDYTVYEVFPPNSKKTVELEITNYKNVNSIGWEIIQAKPY